MDPEGRLNQTTLEGGSCKEDRTTSAGGSRKEDRTAIAGGSLQKQVVLTKEWLPWLQTNWRDSGYERVVFIIED